MKTAPMQKDEQPTAKVETILLEAKLYPNPNNGNMELQYELSGEDNGNLSIVGVDGRIVYQSVLMQDKNVHSISATQLPAGIYYYQISQNKSLLRTDKIIIVK